MNSSAGIACNAGAQWELTVTVFQHYTKVVHDILDDLVARSVFPAAIDRSNITVEPPRDATHGDLAINAAMVLAKPAGTNPRELAGLLIAELSQQQDVLAAEIAGPGFINLRLSNKVWLNELRSIGNSGDEYGRSTLGAGKTVNVEYVSANPTGPMHMGHCRGAVVGDALANILAFAGHEVIREYYVNDAGGQVDTLSRSVHLRYREALGEAIGDIPEGYYPGDYLVPIGQELARQYGDKFAGAAEAEWLILFREFAVAKMMDLIRADLALLGIHHDVFASEAVVQQNKLPEAAETFLRNRSLIYDGVLEAPKGEMQDDWEPVELPLFRSTQFGDDQDRPIKKSNGSWTYFGADMAYHFQKAQKADALINIWGADHAGTVKRIKAAVDALTEGKVALDVKLVQMVRLMRAGELVKMGKRLGNFVTLADVVEEVGKDVVRFTMLTRRADAQMDFDFAKVVEVSKDNPVFYVQYAHARIQSTLRKAALEGLAADDAKLELLGDEELSLIRETANFPRIVEASAKSGEPHRIAFYLGDLAAAFHSYWNLGNDDPTKRFILAQEPELTSARLFLATNIGQVLHNGLRLMGVEATNSM
jgi:arginyl-tRNA synthetase